MSSNSEFDQAGPRPSGPVAHGVVGCSVGDEHPVAGQHQEPVPTSWVSSFSAVSPHPAHAPENSRAAGSCWDPFTVSALTVAGSGSGIDRKNSRESRSSSRWSGVGHMSIALCLTSSLLRAGQTSTQMPQPVQSSGATGSSSTGPAALGPSTPCA